MPKDISFRASARVLPVGDVVHCDLDDEAVLLNLRTRRYFKLNRVSAHVWNILAKGADVESLRRSILDAFEVEPERSAEDLDALLQAMNRAGLVEIRHVSLA